MLNCISNIAWYFEDTEQVFKIMCENQIFNVEVAPLELIDCWDFPNYNKLNLFCDICRDYGISISSMQSIFYKKQINIFENMKKSVKHMNFVKEICNMIKCPYIVFGSPKNRNTNKSQEASMSELNCFFKQLNFAHEGLLIGIEANPAEYGTNFLNNYQQISKYMQEYNQLNSVRTHFDIGCYLLSNNNFFDIKDLRIENMHLSMEYLKNDCAVLENNYRNNIFKKILREDHDKKDRPMILSLEMRKTKISHLCTILANLSKMDL